MCCRFFSCLLIIFLALSDLFEKADILHQDVSLGNMMLVDKYPDYKDHFVEKLDRTDSSFTTSHGVDKFSQGRVVQ